VADIGLFEAAVLVLAVFRVTRFVVKDYLFASVRDWVWDRFPPESTKTGYFITCPWCVGFWLSLVLYTCYTIMPLQTLWVAFVLSLSALSGWLSALDDRI
jgi:hypothetical protein